MKKLFVSIIALSALLTSCADSELESKLKSVLNSASQSYGVKALEVEKSRNAYPFAYADGQMTFAQGEDAWASGYFIGSVWQLSQWSEDAALQETADVLTYRYREPKGISMYDLAAVVNVAHYNGYKITQNGRYDEAVGMVAKMISNSMTMNTYSTMALQQDDMESYHRVSIDRMPTVECFDEVGWGQNNKVHGTSLINYLCREDGSVREGVVLEKTDGSQVKYFSVYGQNEESAWARGQAWALYGYAMLYRLTQEVDFLNQSKKIADYIIKNLPEDGVPNWDFAAETQQKDSSAAAIMASAFIDLYGLTEDEAYLQVAERQLTTLSSDEYLAQVDECGGFLLKHGVDNYPQSKMVDASLVYGDYYFIEAMIRYLNR